MEMFRAACWGSLLPHVFLTEGLVPTPLSRFHVLAPVAWPPSARVAPQQHVPLMSGGDAQVRSLTGVCPLHLLSQHLLQPGAEDFGENLTLGDGVGVTGTHRLEEGGGFGSGGVGRQVEAAQHGQRAARVALGGGESLWNWKRLLLEDTQVQQGAYCVRRSGRQEELDDLSAVFGHEVFALLCVALGYEVTDLLHELHQGFLSHIGWQQGLQFLDDEQTKRTGGVQLLIGTAGSGSVFIGRKLGKFRKFLLFGAAKSKNCTRLLWLLVGWRLLQDFWQIRLDLQTAGGCLLLRQTLAQSAQGLIDHLLRIPAGDHVGGQLHNLAALGAQIRRRASMSEG